MSRRIVHTPMAMAIALTLLVLACALAASNAFAREGAPAVPSLVTGVATAQSGAASLGGADISTPRTGEAPPSAHDELPALSDVFGR